MFDTTIFPNINMLGVEYSWRYNDAAFAKRSERMPPEQSVEKTSYMNCSRMEQLKKCHNTFSLKNHTMRLPSLSVFSHFLDCGL